MNNLKKVILLAILGLLSIAINAQTIKGKITENGDAVFSSMKEFIERGNPVTDHKLSCNHPRYKVREYIADLGATEWVIDMIITDNEAVSVYSALSRLGYDIVISRQTHWEISTSGDRDETLRKIDASGELYNSNKEFISEINGDKNTSSLLIRQKEDMYGRVKFESLTKRFKIKELIELKRGIIWNVSVNGGNFKSVMNDILNTNILFNPLSYECYEIK